MADMDEMLGDLLANAEREAGTVHVGGVCWYEARLPMRWHRCRVQTSGWIGFMRVVRCACGAISLNGGRWRERNSRRRGGIS